MADIQVVGLYFGQYGSSFKLQLIIGQGLRFNI